MLEHFLARLRVVRGNAEVVLPQILDVGLAAEHVDHRLPQRTNAAHAAEQRDQGHEIEVTGRVACEGAAHRVHRQVLRLVGRNQYRQHRPHARAADIVDLDVALTQRTQHAEVAAQQSRRLRIEVAEQLRQQIWSAVARDSSTHRPSAPNVVDALTRRGWSGCARGPMPGADPHRCLAVTARDTKTGLLSRC